ncbi:MAG: hypothetical protein WCG80_01765 [Spirochaetales bacterium]
MGYEVYYKIYPDQLNATTNLARDAGVVSTTPKIETLTSLGYKRLSSATLIHPLLPMDLNTTSKQTVVLDFSAFLASLKFATGTVDEPTASIVSATGTKLTEIVLVRSLSTPNEVRISANFSDLANAVTLIPDSDMDSASVTTATKSFEIEFFIVAYAESRETFVQYYSTPVPWGIISGIMVRS